MALFKATLRFSITLITLLFSHYALSNEERIYVDGYDTARNECSAHASTLNHTPIPEFSCANQNYTYSVGNVTARSFVFWEDNSSGSWVPHVSYNFLSCSPLEGSPSARNCKKYVYLPAAANGCAGETHFKSDGRCHKSVAETQLFYLSSTSEASQQCKTTALGFEPLQSFSCSYYQFGSGEPYHWFKYWDDHSSGQWRPTISSYGSRTCSSYDDENGRTVKNCTPYRFYSCPNSSEYVHPTRGCNAYDEEKNLGGSCPLIGNPINALVGNKFQQEEYFSSANNAYFKISAAYNSLAGKWSVYPLSAAVLPVGGTQFLTEVQRPDGRKIIFRLDGNGEWKAQLDVTLLLTKTSNNGAIGWKIVNNNQTETYDNEGRLTSISSLNADQITIAYDNTTHTATMTDVQSNESMILQLESSSNQVNEFSDPQGLTYRFSYSSTGMLSSITYPDDTPSNIADNAKRIYHYENVNFPQALTGISDETGNRFATWNYDSEGRAISSEHANGVEHASLDYTYIDDAVDPRITTTNELGKQTTYHYTTIHGVRKVTQVEGHASANCAAANQSYTYDANGFKNLVTDWEGNVTDYDHDARGLEVQRIEAKGTPQERAVSTQWHADFRLPTKITEPDRVIDFTYDANGLLLERKETPVP